MTSGRREFLTTLGAAGIASSTQAAPNRSPSNRPNILVFLTDDHGQWLQEAYGNSEVRTPNMSRIARSGVRMTNAFTPTPVCSPARASFFTGLMPSQHGIHDWIEWKTQAYAVPWLAGQTLISEYLKRAGYHTAMVGKWHCGAERIPHRGFDFCFGFWEIQFPHYGEQHFSDNGKEVIQTGLQSALLTDQAIKFLRSHFESHKTSPFFLFVGYTDTHRPHTEMPAELVDQYNEASFRDIPNEPFSPAHGKPLIPREKDPSIERKKLAEYYAAASAIDRQVGRVLDELASRGQLDNTLVIYTGDHGLNAGHHGMWEKGNATTPQNFLEESIRVACALSWPGGGIPKNLESDLPVTHCDLFATLLDVAGAAPDEAEAKKRNYPGRSYLVQLRGGAVAEWRNFVIGEYGNARMIRSDGYKLILRYPFRGVRYPNEFYDLKADPRETTNRYESSPERYGPIIRQMTAQLNEFFAAYTVPGHSGLELESQPMATPSSPWLQT